MYRNLTIILAICLTSTFAFAQSTLTFHNYEAENIFGDTISLSQYYGKKIMVVNTASNCGYTWQYEDLEALYQQYHQYNFEILGFPCNDFGGQEPGSDSAIIDFCTGTYNITFPMMHKVSIINGDTAPVYKWLQRENLNGVQNAHVAWNFNKFLIDEAGHWVAHYLSTTNPMDTAITNWIMSPSVITSVADVSSGGLTVKQLSNYAGSSTIDFEIASSHAQHVNLSLFTIDGKFIETIYDGTVTGTQHLSSTTKSLTNGLYLVRVQSPTFQTTFKTTVVR